MSEVIYAAGPDITEHEANIVMDAMRNGWYGEKAYYYCELFQDEFASYHDRKFGIMTPNCTSAIHLVLAGLGIDAWHEQVLVPECTWVGSTAGITHCGATPVFCDIDKDSWCIDIESVKKNITRRTKAIIGVNVYGNMCNWDELQKLADEHGIFLIEDAAESLGSTYNGIKAGKFGIGSVFSFHRTKTLTTGEGGMLLLDDPELYDRCMFMRDHGRSRTIPYYVEEITFKYMPFNVQAALGYAQLQRLDELIAIKRHHLEFYRTALGDIPGIRFNYEPEGVFNGCWITAMVADKSLNITSKYMIDELSKHGIPARPFFYPLSSLPAYNQKQMYEADNPNAYDIHTRGINLPGAMNLTDKQLSYICEHVRRLV